jgi:hypothetical protein
MDQADRDYCRALLTRYFRRFAEAWRRDDWGAMRFCNRRIVALMRWEQELSEVGDSARDGPGHFLGLRFGDRSS